MVEHTLINTKIIFEKKKTKLIPFHLNPKIIIVGHSLFAMNLPRHHSVLINFACYVCVNNNHILYPCKYLLIYKNPHNFRVLRVYCIFAMSTDITWWWRRNYSFLLLFMFELYNYDFNCCEFGHTRKLNESHRSNRMLCECRMTHWLTEFKRVPLWSWIVIVVVTEVKKKTKKLCSKRPSFHGAMKINQNGIHLIDFLFSVQTRKQRTRKMATNWINESNSIRNDVHCWKGIQMVWIGYWIVTSNQ